ncbi:MAG: hypothetical protein WBQ52_16480 [Terracidiphilus sp.]
MDSSFEITSLFDQRPRVRRGVSAYALSMLMHAAGIGLGGYVLIHAPRIRVLPPDQRYALRELRLNMPQHVPTANDRLYPDPPLPHAAAAKSAAPAPAPRADTPRQAAKTEAPPLPPLPPDGGISKQILMQPKLHIHEQLADTVPVPAAVMWMPELNHTKMIIPAKPTPPTQAVVPPSVAEPNEELEMSEFSVSASALQPKLETLQPSTTTPLAQNGPDLVKLPPTTQSVDLGQPTPTALLSVSEVRMPQGIAVLPPVNEAGTGSKTAGVGARPAANGAGGATGSSSTSAQASASETVDRIQLPPEGRFGVVVVGASQTSQYPEAAEFWSDRIAYTVYLHVGLPKTWILQYGLVNTAQANGTGSIARLDAPWPFDIFRPNLLAVDVNADALMVHGILNASGKLEKLAVAFPEGFPHASFVVNALSRWKFRPASQDGKPMAVEVLLIIPEEDD